MNGGECLQIVIETIHGDIKHSIIMSNTRRERSAKLVETYPKRKDTASELIVAVLTRLRDLLGADILRRLSLVAAEHKCLHVDSGEGVANCSVPTL